MIGSSLDIVSFQYLGQFFYFFSGKTVDNTALPWMLLDELDDILINIHRLRTYFIIEVGTVERTLELLGIQNAQILLDVSTHLISGRRSQRNNRSFTYLIDNGTNATIFRTEVMAPF